MGSVPSAIWGTRTGSGRDLPFRHADRAAGCSGKPATRKDNPIIYLRGSHTIFAVEKEIEAAVGTITHCGLRVGKVTICVETIHRTDDSATVILPCHGPVIVL